MKQKSLKMSDSFWQAVEDHRVKYQLTWTEALIVLASIGLDEMTGKIPATLGRRGGDHRSEKFRKTVRPVE